MSRTLSSLQHVEIVDEDGTRLGRLRELRCAGTPGGRSGTAGRVETLVYGAAGWLERLGLPHASDGEVAWKHVVRVEAGTIIVRRAVRAKRPR